MFTHQSAFDTSPAIKFLADAIAPYGEIKRAFTVAAVDANTGIYETFDQTNVSFEELPTAVMASSSIPFVFPPQHFHGFVLMDGGTVYDVNIDSAVNQCLDMGFEEKDIIMDVVVCGDSERHGEKISMNAYTNFSNGKTEHDFYVNTNSI